MPDYDVYNPLDYDNLTKGCVEELMRRGPYKLPLKERFTGAGVYALFYTGDFAPYAPIRSPKADRPIYVGKAVPPGARKGALIGKIVKGADLYKRIANHVNSIQDAQNLRTQEFLCRYLVVTPLWIIMAERFLIEHYRPLWNVCIEGFGIHDPGRGRREGVISWWDALHPGRQFAKKLRKTRTTAQAIAFVKNFFTTPPPHESSPSAKQQSQED